jgi:hypothetical protein
VREAWTHKDAKPWTRQSPNDQSPNDQGLTDRGRIHSRASLPEPAAGIVARLPFRSSPRPATWTTRS